MRPDCLAEARSLLTQGEADVFSLDIFDTLLFRRCTFPDGVFERAFFHARLGEDCAHLCETFVQHRTIAESKARAAKLETAGTSEVGIADIYELFPVQVYGLSPADRPRLAEAEFQAELELCMANPDMRALATQAVEKGLRIGLFSDTFWSREQLRRLVRHTLPDLSFDFVYPSCEFGRNKASGLFEVGIAGEGLVPRRMIHIGDHPIADVDAPRRLGIRAIHYPQCDEAFYQILRREDMAARLVRAEHGNMALRADQGLRVLRRMVAARLPSGVSPARQLGAQVVGPLFTGHHHFLMDKIAAFHRPGRKVAVAFAARDGFLPKQVWDHAGCSAAHYLELNRRTTLVAGSHTIKPLLELIEQIPMVDLSVVNNLLKTPVAGAAEYFRGCPHGLAPGAEFAKVLATLLSDAQIREVSALLRAGLMAYLRASLPDLDQLTDLVLVDIGYEGSIQKSLRRIFDLEGLSIRVHGLYLAIVDHNLVGLRDGDTACGFIDDTVMTPIAKMGLLRNITLLEQFSSAPVGACREYRDGKAVREEDRRKPEQLALCAEVRDGVLDFFDAYQAVAEEFGIDPLGQRPLAQQWGLAIMARLLLMSTDAERTLLQELEQDVNLGSSMRMRMLAGEETWRAWHSLPIKDVFQIREPPTWLAGSLTNHLPAAGYSYAMAVFGLLPPDLFAEVTREKIQVAAITGGGSAQLPAALQSTAFGEIRLRIPLIRQHTGSVLAIPLTGAFRRGLLRGVVLQGGNSVAAAVANRVLFPITLESIQPLNAVMDGNFFRAGEGDSHLLIQVPQALEPVAVVTIDIISDVA